MSFQRNNVLNSGFLKIKSYHSFYTRLNSIRLVDHKAWNRCFQQITCISIWAFEKSQYWSITRHSKEGESSSAPRPVSTRRDTYTQYTPTYLYIFFPNRSSKNGFAFGADTLGTRARTCFKQQTKQSSSLAITSSRWNATGKILRQSLLSRIVIIASVLPVSFLLVFDACYLGIQWPRSRTWS